MQQPDPEMRRRKAGGAYALAKLTGQADGGALPTAITPPGGGGKFSPDGQVLAFPGNTFLCHIDPQSAFFAALCTVQDRLRDHPLADHFTFLPKPSFHMTVFCGVSGSPLGSDGWPRGFAPGATLDQITEAYDARLSRQTFQTGFSVRPAGLILPNSVAMQAATDADEAALRRLRAELEELTGLYRGDVHSYEFHVSLAYIVNWISEEPALKLIEDCAALFDDHLRDCATIRFETVAFCSFPDMHRFDDVRTF